MTENERRAERAFRTILYYGQWDGSDQDDVETLAGDFLTDLRHLCDESGYDWELILSRADLHYTAETH
jgi:hypothetical protein